MRSPANDIPCPCCGFLTLEGSYGSYAICPLCDWEDDPAQLANPTLGGGANKGALADAQEQALLRYPVDLQIFGGYRRGLRWRPLTASELTMFNERRAHKHWNSSAVLDEHEAYWAKPRPA